MEPTLCSLAGKKMDASLCVTSIARIFWRATKESPDEKGTMIDVPEVGLGAFKINMSSKNMDNFTIEDFEKIVPEIEWAYQVCSANFNACDMNAIIRLINCACVQEITLRIAEIEHYTPEVVRLSDRGLAALDLFGAQIGIYDVSREEVNPDSFAHIEPIDRERFIKWAAFSGRKIPSMIINFARTLHDIFARCCAKPDGVAKSYDQLIAYSRFIGFVADFRNIEEFYPIWYSCDRKEMPILHDIVECMLDRFIEDYPQEVEKISSNCQVLRAHYFAWYD